MSDLYAAPITRAEAFAFIGQFHRHHKPPLNAIFHVALARSEQIVGVAVVGRPVARALCNGWTAEVTRLCTLDAPESRHAASKLYAMCWRVAREMGYRRLLTYTRADETGVSLVAAGWRAIYQTESRSWNMPSRPRVDKTELVARTLWEVSANGRARARTDVG